jgi:hypothetical protein
MVVSGKRMARYSASRIEGDQRPEAAGHGVDMLFLIELAGLLLQLAGVALMPLLQLRDLGLQGAHAHHALFALHLEGHQDQLDDQCEEKHRNAVVADEVVQRQQQPAEGFGDIIP